MSEVNFTLPVSEVTTRFAGRSTHDKLRIIELGINLYEKGSETYLSWDNKETHSQLESLQKQIEREKERFERERGELVETITQQQQDKTASRVESLSTHIQELEKHNHSLMAQLQDIYNSTETRVTERIRQTNTVYEDRIRDLEVRLDQSRQAYETLLGRNTTSALKGQDGENFIQKQLTLMYPKAEIEDTSQQPGRGDLIFNDDGLTMMIESKNYTKNVQKSEIDKFYRDLERETNNDIQCAVFVSLTTGICCREDFAFEVVNNKPVFFIHNFKQSISSIRLAINLFRNFLSSNELDTSNKEVVCGFKNIASSLKRNFNKQKKALDKHHSEQIENLSAIEAGVMDLYKLTKIKY